MLGNQREKLLDLVHLGLTANGLQVQPVFDARVSIEAVTPSLAIQDEAEIFDKFRKLGKSDISSLSFDQPLEQLAPLQTRALATDSIRLRSRCFSIRTAHTLYSGMRASGS